MYICIFAREHFSVRLADLTSTQVVIRRRYRGNCANRVRMLRGTTHTRSLTEIVRTITEITKKEDV